MVNLALRVRVLYPDARPFIEWQVSADDHGERINFWDAKALGPQPTEKQLDDVTQEQIDGLPAQLAALAAQKAKEAAKASVDKGKLAEGSADQRLTRSIALALLDEVNTLRALQGLQPRTEDDITRGIKEKIDLTPSAAIAEAADPVIGGRP